MVRRRLDPVLHGSAGFTSIGRLAALVAVVGFFAVGFHLSVQAWYDGRLMPGVVVGGYDLGGQTVGAARAVLLRQAAKYHLQLNIAGTHYDLTAPQLGVTFDTEATLAAAYSTGRASWVPPLHPTSVELAYHVDRTQLTAFVTSVADRTGTAPVDATVAVSGLKLSAVPEQSGWSIDKAGLAKLITADVAHPGGSVIAIKAREQLADIQAAHLGPTIDEAKALMATPIVLTYGSRVFTPTASDIGQWLSFVKAADGAGSKLEAQVDQVKLKGYVQKLANQLDVAPVNELDDYVDGVLKVNRVGADGSAIDQDPLTTAIAAAVSAEQPLTFTITSHVVAFKVLNSSFTTLDYPKYIEVNLSKQHLWVWQDGAIIYDTPITSGATGAGFPTVTGLFSIYYKTTNTHLIGYQYGPRYNYDVAVKYWMPFYSGYGLHDASWRNGNFGGSDYYYGGSHGCVNLPDAAAAFIYGWSDVGTPVWVHN